MDQNPMDQNPMAALTLKLAIKPVLNSRERSSLLKATPFRCGFFSQKLIACGLFILFLC